VKKITLAPAAAAAVALSLALWGCTESAEEPAAENPLLAASVPDGAVRGTVVDTMNSGGYTFVFIENEEQKLWAAGPESVVGIGDIVQVSTRMPMSNFESKSLGRTFDVIYFSSVLQNLSAPAPAVEGHPAPMQAQPAAAKVEVEALEPGKNIAYVYANREELAGQEISLRGTVVKYNAKIMGRNFIHIQDGSGDASEGNNDLTVTTTTAAAVGDTVVVTGAIILDKDFGSGYTFPVLMEDATLLAEDEF
jgi:hypothetical protein